MLVVLTIVGNAACTGFAKSPGTTWESMLTTECLWSGNVL